MSGLKGLILDFDGVLANTEPLHLRAYQTVLAEIGVPLEETTYYERYLGFDDVGVFEAIGRDQELSLGKEEISGMIARKSRYYDGLVERLDVVFPGAGEAVDRLAASVPLAIASGALRGEIEGVLGRARLLQHFPIIVAAGETPRSKPAPDPYLRAAALLDARVAGHASGTFVAIEDSPWGLESARAAGLACVAVTQTYPADRLGLADLVVSSLADLSLDALRRLAASTAGPR
jgi:beta-phosphoglucomutase